MAADLVVKRNDLLPVLTVICRDVIGPVDLSGYTALFRMVNVLNGEVKVNASATVATDAAFTADVSTDTLTASSHGLNDGDDVTLRSSGVLPAGLDTQTKYYVINSTASTLQLSLSLNGSAIDITGAGSGTHTLLSGKVSYEWTGTDTDTAGSYFSEIQTTFSGKTLTYPNDRQLLVEVVSGLA